MSMMLYTEYLLLMVQESKVKDKRGEGGGGKGRVKGNIDSHLHTVTHVIATD